MIKYLTASLAALAAYALVGAYLSRFGAQNFWFLSGAGWVAFAVFGAVLYFWGKK